MKQATALLSQRQKTVQQVCREIQPFGPVLMRRFPKEASEACSTCQQQSALDCRHHLNYAFTPQQASSTSFMGA